jgi:hypothetical protein
MNMTFRTNIKLLISTLRTASLNLADDAARNVENKQKLHGDARDKNKDGKQ